MRSSYFAFAFAFLAVGATTASAATLACDRTIIVGGEPILCTVTLNGPSSTGGTNVTLSSSDPSIAGNPSPWTIPVAAGASSATFTVATRAVPSNKNVTLTAGSQPGVTLTLVGPAIINVTLNPSGPTGGAPSTGTITLNGPAKSSETLTVTLSSNNPAASVPSSITIGSGKTSANFNITTQPVQAATSVTISAQRHLATTRQTAILNVVAPVLRGLRCEPAKGGGTAICTVYLTGAAPWGATVKLTSSKPAVVSIAPTVTMRAATASVITHTTRPASPTVVEISASYLGKTDSDLVTVTHSGVETP